MSRVAAVVGATAAYSALLPSVAALSAASSPSATGSRRGCAWQPPVACAPTFEFGGQLYVGCTTAGAQTGEAWCAHTADYQPEAWSKCSYTCDDSVVAPAGPVVLPFANNWMPSGDELEYLQDAVKESETSKSAFAKRYEALKKEFEEADKAYKQQNREVEEAKAKLAVAKQIGDDERRRAAALPSLARLAQKQALEEHERRVAAEKRVEELRKVRKQAEEARGSSMDRIRQAITKQRLINRVQAAEDARIIEAATEAARVARGEILRQQIVEKQVQDALDAAQRDRETAARLAAAVLLNATRAANAQVANHSAQVTQLEQDKAVQRRSLELLRQQAERSADLAAAAAKIAAEDRARARAAAEQEAGHLQVAAQMEGQAANLSAEVISAATRAEQQQAEADAAAAARGAAVADAAGAQAGAVRSLKVAAQDMSRVASVSQNAGKLAAAAPAAFIRGINSTLSASASGD
eukprot:TRINITY_DN71645_c0_g1_i1.p1 TRINITY_DN71645_c0_g1~~TRINITY_DN71645_c0_g1_i1.p1  ORF type:complete len:513 (-),score=161.94 TRINITY_DN71645_c0_g1_i1:19-1422(-)